MACREHAARQTQHKWYMTSVALFVLRPSVWLMKLCTLAAGAQRNSVFIWRYDLCARQRHGRLAKPPPATNFIFAVWGCGKIMKENPDRVLFFAVGLETTAPANALSVVHAHREGGKLSNHNRNAGRLLWSYYERWWFVVTLFLVVGYALSRVRSEYYPGWLKNIRYPLSPTGLEPADLCLEGILMTVKQLEVMSASWKSVTTWVLKLKEIKMQLLRLINIWSHPNCEWRGRSNNPLKITVITTPIKFVHWYYGGARRPNLFERRRDERENPNLINAQILNKNAHP